jgi:Fe-S-cluster-containing dehydrogenase component
MIQLDYLDRSRSTQTIPVVCMHCDSPTCAEVCPADAIKRTEDGIVQTARKPRCIACNNCVLACPFGVPKMNTRMNLMMKCDMCYDRTSVGLKPMCASVCPSQALAFGTREEMSRSRPRAKAVNTFQFGRQLIRTKVNVMVPLELPQEIVDVTSAMYEPSIGHDVLDDMFVSEELFSSEKAG